MKDGLEFSSRELRSFAHQLTEDLIDYLEGLSRGFPGPRDPAISRVRGSISEPVPDHGEGLLGAWENVQEKIIPWSTKVGHPHFLAWIRTSPLAGAVFTEAVTAALNQSVAVWEGAPAAAEVEKLVLEWLVELSGYQPGAGGILTSGGSMANFTGLAAARTRLDPEIREKGLSGGSPMTLYLTRETHYSVIKAVELLGIGRGWVRYVPVDDRLRMDPSALKQKIKADKMKGYRPLAVAATLGTTSTGACDDLAALAAVCQEEEVWLHVDGAYGGLAALDPGKAHLARGLEQADSFVLDPHKNLFMPFEVGCVLIRDWRDLRNAFAVRTDYLPNSEMSKSGKFPSGLHFRDYGPQLSRRFRALKIYLALKAYGVGTIAAEMTRQHQLADHLGKMISEAEDFQLLAGVSLGIVAFCYQPPGDLPLGEINVLHERMVREIQRQGRIFLSQVKVGEKVGFRVCFVSHRTRVEHLAPILEEIRRAAGQV